MSNENIFHTLGSKERLVDRVVNEIQNLIVDNKLKPGFKLPPERELAEQIGVSRTVVREAVRILGTKGLLETKHGIGTVVRELNGDQISEHLNIMLQTKGIALDNLYHVRQILEVEIARVAATQATEASIQKL
jgi:GntR family transcriptional repressor for pyruvate dehydrogenase complex